MKTCFTTRNTSFKSEETGMSKGNLRFDSGVSKSVGFVIVGCPGNRRSVIDLKE